MSLAYLNEKALLYAYLILKFHSMVASQSSYEIGNFPSIFQYRHILESNLP